MPNITNNHAITYTNLFKSLQISKKDDFTDENKEDFESAK